MMILLDLSAAFNIINYVVKSMQALAARDNIDFFCSFKFLSQREIRLQLPNCFASPRNLKYGFYFPPITRDYWKD